MDCRDDLRKVDYLLALAVLLAACTTPESTPSERFTGAYVWGHEVNTFQSCGEDEVYWVIAPAPILMQLQDHHSSVAGKPYHPIHITFIGNRLDDETDGFAIQYDGYIEVSELLDWNPTVPLDCRIE